MRHRGEIRLYRSDSDTESQPPIKEPVTMSPISLDPSDQAILENAVQLGLQHAADGLSGMIGHRVRLEPTRIVVLPMSDVQAELPPAEDVMLGVHLTLT